MTDRENKGLSENNGLHNAANCVCRAHALSRDVSSALVRCATLVATAQEGETPVDTEAQGSAPPF